MISPGLRIGRYEIGKRLGKGGFGVVHAARDVDLDREIAIKVLKPEYLTRPQIVQRFLQEARAAAKIGHAGIVTVFECGQIQGTGTRADGNAYIAMEMLVGESLGDRLMDGGRMGVTQAIAITRQLAGALAAAHTAGIVHRDLKPDNVFLVPDPAVHGGERVKILDFGVAKLMEPSEDDVNTHSQMMLGTPKYMSPEQARSASKVDHRSDIYTLGCMLYEMVTGRAPFGGDSGEQLIAHQKSPPPSARALVGTVPMTIDALIRRMLAKSPDERPQSMTNVVDALADPIDEPDTMVRPPIVPRSSAEITTVSAGLQAIPEVTTVAESRIRKTRDQRLLLAVVGLTVLVVSGIVVFVMMRGDEKATPAPVAYVDAMDVDAGAVVAVAEVPIDAPGWIEIYDGHAPTDEVDQLRLECKEAADKQNWSNVISCAEKLKLYDGVGGDALYKLGHSELRAEASDRALGNAVRDGDFKRAKLAFESISIDSVYRFPAEVRFKDLEKQLAEKFIAMAATTPNCKTYDKLLAQISAATGPSIANIVKREVSCKPEDRKVSKNDTNLMDPKKDGKAAPCNADELSGKGMDAFSGGANPQALVSFEAAYKCKPDANTLKFTFAAACKSGNAAKARTYWRKMSQTMKDATLAFCVSNGIMVHQLNAP